MLLVVLALLVSTGFTSQVAAATAVAVTGNFHAVIADDLRSRSETLLSLETATGTIPLVVPAGLALPPEGTRVRVLGGRGPGAAVTVTSIEELGAPSPVTASSSATRLTSATRSVLVIIADFTDIPADPVTPAQAVATFTGAGPTVGAFYAAASRGRVAMMSTIVGPWSLGIASTCDPNAVWSAGEAIAASHGLDPNAFDHVVVWTSAPACAWWVGVGTIGMNLVWISDSFPNGPDAGATMTVVASHEIGHNLGLLHASSYPCWDANGNQVSFEGTCSGIEYGDPFSTMGQGYSYESLFDSGELRGLGWLAPGETEDVAAAGTYSLVPTYSALPGIRLVRIPRAPLFAGTGPGYWWLEIRGVLGESFDRFDIPGGWPVPAGVSVRFGGGSENGNSFLIDAAPTGTGSAYAVFNDAPFVPGQTFSDPVGGLTIRVDAASATGATVTIDDTQPPTAPGPLVATGDGGGIRLDWGAASDNLGLASYVVRRDGVAIATVSASTLVHVDDAVAPGSPHTYEVAAVDTADHEGPTVSTVVVVPTVPDAPTEATAVPGNGAALVSWSAPAYDGGSVITGYAVTSDPDGKSCRTSGARSCTVGGLANGTTYRFTVVAANEVGSGPESAPSDPITPRAAPGASITALPTWIASTSIPLSWSGAPGSATVVSFDVRYRRAAWNGGFGAYATWRSGTATTTGTFSASSGSTYCFSARARDATDVPSPWTPDTCTAIPLDDRSLSRAGGWTAGTGTAYYRSTYLRSSTSGAKLVRTGVRARSIAIVATTCPTCGKIRVYWGRTVLRTINLASHATVNRRLFLVETFPSARSGTMTIKVLSGGRRVLIDAIVARGL